MSISINFKLTQAGQAAIWNAGNTGVSLNLTHVQLGSGTKAQIDGLETALISPKQAVAIAGGSRVGNNQIRMSAIFTGNTSFSISEVGLWAGVPNEAGSVLVAYWAKSLGNLAVKSAGVDFVFSHDMYLNGSVPVGSITILADQTQSGMLAALASHEAKTDPHPQYTTDAEVIALIEARVGDYVTSTNIGNSYTVVLDPPVTSYTSKTAFAFKASATNTGGQTTLNAGGGAKSLIRDDGAVMQAGDIQAGMVITVVYDVASNCFISTQMVASQLSRMAPLTGEGTSGTWPISIDGSAGSAPASDVFAWAKQATKPSYSFSEIGNKPTTLSGYGITNSSFGDTQVWAECTRVRDTYYRNTTGRAIAVSVQSSSNIDLIISRTGLADNTWFIADCASGAPVNVVSSIVPVDMYYKVVGSSIDHWYELK